MRKKGIVRIRKRTDNESWSAWVLGMSPLEKEWKRERREERLCLNILLPQAVGREGTSLTRSPLVMLCSPCEGSVIEATRIHSLSWRSSKIQKEASLGGEKESLQSAIQLLQGWLEDQDLLAISLQEMALPL